MIKRAIRVSATEAARTFSDLVNRAHYRGEEFVVVRGGESVARLGPARSPSGLTLGQLAALLREVPAPDASFGRDVRRAVRKQPRPPRPPWGR